MLSLIVHLNLLRWCSHAIHSKFSNCYIFLFYILFIGKIKKCLTTTEVLDGKPGDDEIFVHFPIMGTWRNSEEKKCVFAYPGSGECVKRKAYESLGIDVPYKVAAHVTQDELDKREHRFVEKFETHLQRLDKRSTFKCYD